MLSHRKFLIVGLVVCLFSSTGQNAMGKELPQITMKTYSVVSVFNLPPWSSETDIEKGSEVFRDEGRAVGGHKLFIWEAIPKGETFQQWTKLYALTAEHSLSGSITNYVENILDRGTRNCSNSATQFSRTTRPTTKLFIFYCESYKDQPNLGEVSFFNVQLINKTLVKNYLHVRVPSFSLEKPSEFPMKSDELLNNIKSVAALRVTVNQD